MVDAGAPVAPMKALGILAAVVVVIAGFLGLMAAVGNHEAWAGFLFLLYWSMAEGMKLEALPKSVVGALVGIGIASLLFLLPQTLGATIGGLTFLAVVLVLVYLQIRNSLPIAVNMATMIFLTVGTIPHLQSHASFIDSLAALLLGTAYFGGLAFAMSFIGRRTGAPPKAAPIDSAARSVTAGKEASS